MKRLCLLYLVLLASSAFAEDYYWTNQKFKGFIFTEDSPSAVVERLIDINNECSPEKTQEIRDSLTRSTDTSWSVKMWYSTGSSCYSQYRPIIRGGDSCPGQGVFNPDTGECEEPFNCDEAKPVMSDNNYPVVCHNNCRYLNLGGFRDYDNPLSVMRYEYIPSYTSCTGDEQPIEGAASYDSTDDQDNPCQTYSNTQLCIDKGDGCTIVNGKKTCPDDKTDKNCGLYNGELVCYSKDQTNCGYVNGEYLCIYPDGDKISSYSPDHPQNGGNGNKSQSDDILDQEDIDTNSAQSQKAREGFKQGYAQSQGAKQQEKDEPANTFSGFACDKTVACSGDAIQCAIARYQKKEACLFEYKESELQTLVDANPNSKPLGTYESDTTIIDIEGMITEEGRFTESNQCPDPLSFGVMGKEFQIAFDPMCDLAGYIRYFILFATWFSAAVLIAKSF